MIRDLTESLEAFLDQPGLPTELGDAVISFERPTEPFAPAAATIDLFLFEIRENVQLRNNEPVTRRVGMQVIQAPPPVRVSCTYLVTAWPGDGADVVKREHRLLSQVLQLFQSTPVLPEAFLTGTLIGQEPPLPMMLVDPDGIRNPAEFWTAIGNRLKPSLLLSVTIAMAAAREESAPIVITHGIEINGTPVFRIGGVVTDAAAAAVPAAQVELVDRGRRTQTNGRGQFSLAAVPAGTYGLRAAAGASAVARTVTVPATGGANYDLQLA